MNNEDKWFEKYQNAFESLEDAGHLEGSVKKDQDGDSITKFMDDPANKKFMDPDLLSEVEKREKVKKKNVDKRTKAKPIDGNLMESIIDDMGTVDWEVVASLYKEGKRRGFIE